MKISEIELHNIKSFYDEIIKFDDSYNIFIGANGSGKSNLFDILVSLFRRYFIFQYQMNNSNTKLKKVDNINDAVLAKSFLVKTYGHEYEISTIKFKIKVEQSDIDDINFMITNREGKSNYHDLYDNYETIKEQITTWITALDELPSAGEEIDITITDRDKIGKFKVLPTSFKGRVISQYLNYVRLFNLLEEKNENLLINSIYFSPHRNSGTPTLYNAILSNNSMEGIVQDISKTSSKTNSSNIQLAVYELSNLKSLYIHNGEEENWLNDPSVSSITNALEKIGYVWDLKLIDRLKQSYVLQIIKNGKEMLIQDASSGEKAIIDLIFSIYFLGIKNGFVFIDEPEVHLHPRWQKLMMEVIVSLTGDTNNQFFIATHSTSFVNNITCNNIIRLGQHKDTGLLQLII